MNQMTLDGMMQDHANRECWAGRPEAAAQGAWLAQLQPAPPGAEAGADTRTSWLLRTIEAEIIPRLMLAHQTAPMGSTAGDLEPPVIGRDEVVAFANLVVAQPAAAAIARVEGWRSEGLPLDAIYLDLLAPAARQLGELWEADICDFTQVTLGLWRLQQVMFELSPAFQNEATFSAQRRRALLAPAPGSQHTLGLLMVAEFFRRAGWDVSGEPTTSAADLLAAVRAEWFDVVGLSVGAECQVEALSGAILALRKASRNKSIGVMVGGPLLAAHPECVAAIGADATAADAPNAVVQAENLVAQREKRC